MSTQLFVTGGEHLSSPSLITYNTATSRPTFLVDSSVMSTYVTSTIRTLRITASESMTYSDQVLVPGEEAGTDKRTVPCMTCRSILSTSYCRGMCASLMAWPDNLLDRLIATQRISKPLFRSSLSASRQGIRKILLALTFYFWPKSEC